jgi:uncharacterized protein YndB with AHSA1/START domain
VRHHTVTAVLDAPRDRVFRYLSDVENLPSWATEFARELRREGDRWIITNNLGEFLFEIRADEDSGVVDMYAGPSADQLGIFPARVVGLPDGRSAFTFTMFQGPDQSADQFERQYESLLRELENVKREVGAAP